MQQKTDGTKRGAWKPLLLHRGSPSPYRILQTPCTSSHKPMRKLFRWLIDIKKELQSSKLSPVKAYGAIVICAARCQSDLMWCCAGGLPDWSTIHSELWRGDSQGSSPVRAQHPAPKPGAHAAQDCWNGRVAGAVMLYVTCSSQTHNTFNSLVNGLSWHISAMYELFLVSGRPEGVPRLPKFACRWQRMKDPPLTGCEPGWCFWRSAGGQLSVRDSRKSLPVTNSNNHWESRWHGRHPCEFNYLSIFSSNILGWKSYKSEDFLGL